MNKTHFKRATALTLVVTLVLCQGFVTGTPLTQVVSKVKNYVTGASTAKALRLPAAAHLSAQGSVTLNGHAAPTGATVFSGGGVKTAENSTAVLSFGTMGQVELATASDFTLAVEGTTLGGQLRAGRAIILAPAGVAVKIVTADGPVVADGREATNLTIDVTAGKTRVETSGSRAETTAAAGDEGATEVQAGATAQGETQKTLAELREAARAAADAAEAAARAAGGFNFDIFSAARNARRAAAATNYADARDAAEDARADAFYVRRDADSTNPAKRATEAAARAAANAARAVADALALAEAKAKADAGNGGGGPGLGKTLQFLMSAAGLVLGIATLERVNDNNTVSPITPGAGS